MRFCPRRDAGASVVNIHLPDLLTAEGFSVRGGVIADTFKPFGVDTDGMEFVLLSYSERTGFTGIASARTPQRTFFLLPASRRAAFGLRMAGLVMGKHS